ncbi:hypothetical protein F5880DRAFT_1618305 [Lentinula raphanica]|nr:hypothetical protein F5880DRAFT_1618305 [Lentinula raphanica]
MCQHGWVFPEASSESSSFFKRHERLAIQLLRFTGKGNINNNAKTPRLGPGKIHSENMTLAQLVSNTTDYGIAKYAVTSDKRFLLHTVIRSSNVSLNINLYEKGLGTENTTRLHHCLSKRIYGIFRSDTDALVDEGYKALNEEEMEMGCQDHVAETSIREAPVVAQHLVPLVFPSMGSPSSSNNNTNSLIDVANSEAESQAAIDVLWELNYDNSAQISRDLYFSNRSRIFHVVDQCYRRVLGFESTGIMVKGQDTQHLLQEFCQMVQHALENEDFTGILSENRHFKIINIDQNGIETYVTSGPGLEKEVMNLFYQTYVKNSDFLVTLIDDYTTLATIPVSSSSDIPQAKLDQLAFFGAAVGISLVHGTYPANINPLLLIYLLNSCKLNSISKLLVLELFPELYTTLTRWLALDPSDDTGLSSFQSHFATFHNSVVSTLRGRSKKLHHSLAWKMLYAAVVGPTTTDHPYFKSFIKGLLLPCKIINLDLSELTQNFNGGSTEFVVSLLETHITGDYGKLRLEYVDRTEWSTKQTLEEAYASVCSEWSAGGFEAIFQEFLEGKELPCPALMQDLQGRFDSVVALEAASDKAFRMRMFCWAVSGAPQIFLDGQELEVS